MDEIDSSNPTDSRHRGDEVRLRARPMSRGVAIGRIVCLHGTTRQFYRVDIQDRDIDRELRRPGDIQSWAIEAQAKPLEKSLWSKRNVTVYDDLPLDDFVEHLRNPPKDDE